MKRSNNITPPTDLTNSREYYGMYNSRDFYRGTSFKMSGYWTPNTHYFNDEYIVDFVAWDGALLSCVRSHISSESNRPVVVKDESGAVIGIKTNPYWIYVMSGTEGPAGKVWVPEVKNGIISWKLDDENPTSIPSADITGPQGPEGKTPVLGLLKRGDLYYLTVNGEPLKDPETEENVPVQGPKGDTGDTGPKGADGKTPVFKIENGNWMLSYDNNKWENLGKAVGEDGVNGKDGKNGKDGITPYLRIENGRWMLSMDNQSSWKDIGQATGARGPEGRPGIDGRNGRDGKDGEDGISPILKITDNKWYVSYNDGATWQVLGRSIGDQGEPGKTPKLIRVFGDPATLLDDRILWGYDGVPVSEWTVLCYLNELKGDSIKSVNITDAEGSLELTMESSKVITATGSVLPRFNAGTIETVEWDQNPSLVIDKTNAPREWALNVKVPKGKPATVTVVSEVEKLAPDAQPYVTDLNPDISDANLKFGIPQGEKGDPGDENIAIGCQSDFPNNEPEHDKIWYDPCDESMDQYSVQDFLYHSYIAVGGILNQEQFEAAWKSFPNTAGFEIKFANSFEELGDPTADKLGKLYMIPAQSTVLHDLFEEYIVVHSPSTTEEVYMWEKWGSGQITVDLNNYYTKSQVDSAISTAKSELEAADTALEGQITTVTNQLTNKVDKVEGSGLISDTDLNQIRTNKADIESLTTSVGGKQDELTPGDAVSITEENVIDVKVEEVAGQLLTKSANGLRAHISSITGAKIKVGTAITGGVEIGADQTVAAGMQALSDSIQTAVSRGITSLTSPDKTITITSTGTSRGLAINTAKLVSTTSSIQVGDDGKLDMFWMEVE